MSKNKLIAIITCGALFVGSISASAIITDNTNTNIKEINNQILLSAPTSNNQGVVINTNQSPLVLYTQPNTNSSVADYLSIGEMLTYQTTSNPNFYKVTVQETGDTGYISSNNIQIIASGVNQGFNPLSEQGQVINVTSNVKLRSQPDMQGSVLATYKNNANINILGKQGQWYKVEIGNQTGYIYQEYVGLDNSTVNNSPNNNTTPNSSSNNNANNNATHNATPNSSLNNNATTNNNNANNNTTSSNNTNPKIKNVKQSSATFSMATINKSCDLYEGPNKNYGPSLKLTKGQTIFILNNTSSYPVPKGWTFVRTAMGAGYLPLSEYTISNNIKYVVKVPTKLCKLYSRANINSATNMEVSSQVLVPINDSSSSKWTFVIAPKTLNTFESGYLPSNILASTSQVGQQA
ncbi:MAG: SH3 domain-containing protein [Sarcina sp.]